MSESASTPPPAAPIPNAVIPSNFNALADAQLNLARSPLERALEAPSGPPQMGAVPPGTMDFDARFRAAQAQDAGRDPRSAQAVANVASGRADSVDAQTGPQADPNAPKPNLEFRAHKNGRTVRKEREWNALSATREEALARATSLEAELAAARGNGVSTPQAQTNGQIDYSKLSVSDLYEKHPDIKRLKEERDTFYEEVKHTRVEADPEFRAKFDSRRDAAIRIAKSVAGGAGDDIARIMSINDSDTRRTQLAERIKDFGEGSKAKIIAAVGALDSLDVEREMEITSRKATWERTQAARQSQQSAQFNQRVAKLDHEFGAVAARWADPEKGMPFVMRDPNKVIADAKRIFSGESDSTVLAESAMKAATYGDLLQLAQSAFQELERVNQQLTRYTGVYPGDDTGGGGQVPALQNATITPADLYNPGYVQSFEQRLAAARTQDALKTYGR